MKKLLASFICIVLVFSLIVPAFAASYVPQFTKEAAYLKSLGLYNGTSKGFELDKTINRVEGSVIFLRLIGEEKEASVCIQDSPFTDITGSNSWAKPYINYMYNKGYTSGISKNLFGTGAMSANEFSTLILRSLGYSDKEGDFNWRTACNDFNLLKVDDYTARGEYIAQPDLTQPARRDFVVAECYDALKVKLKNQDVTLLENLALKGVVSSIYAPEPVTVSTNTDINFLIDWLTSVSDSGYELTATENQTAKDIVSEIITPSLSQHDKLLTIHDYIVNKVEYGYPEGNKEASYSASGVFVYSKAVCSGYARAFEAMAKAAGFEVTYLSANEMDHAWNMVKLGNDWYHVDVTWDDPVGGSLEHKYFLMPDSVMEKNHNWDHKKYPAATNSQYVPAPVLSPEQQAINATEDSAITVNTGEEFFTTVKDNISARKDKFAIICTNEAPPESSLGDIFGQAFYESSFKGVIGYRYLEIGNKVIFYDITYEDKQQETWHP